MTHAKLHSNISVFFGQMNDTHVEEKIKSSAGGGLFNLVPGVMNTFGVLVTRVTTRAIFVAFNMLQAKLHFNISVFLVVQWTIPTLNNKDNDSNVMMFKGVVKELDQFIVDYRDTYGQSNDLPDKQVDQERQTF
jgi:hypothetical protein